MKKTIDITRLFKNAKNSNESAAIGTAQTKCGLSAKSAAQTRCGMPAKCAVLAMVIVSMMFAIPAVNSYAVDGFLTPGATTTTGQQYDFTVNLADKVEEDEVYTLYISVSPTPQSIAVNGVNASVNRVTNSISINSSDLKGISAFSVTLYLGEVTEETTYTVNATIAGTVSNTDDSFTFTAKPANSGASSGGDASESDGRNDRDGKDKPGDDNPQDMKDSDRENPGGGQNPQTGGQGTAGGRAQAGSSASVAGSGSVDESLVYEGSSSNYLKSLSVSGYKFTRKFNTTRDTYFVNVPADTTSLAVKATAADSDATVCVTGDEDVSVEMSKILVTVTAENGSVRTYRIYVTHNREEK